jgi:methylamine--corrinoid protein Co-methyltransferase
MITLLEIAERTQIGEKVEEKKWDMEFFQTISELVKKYDIKTPDEHSYINTDDELVERAYEAAIEFLEKMGIYCITTRRRVKLSREDILTAISFR